MKYLIFQVGCIECGLPSYPIALAGTLEDAAFVARSHPRTRDGYVMVIDLEQVKAVDEKEWPRREAQA